MWKLNMCFPEVGFAGREVSKKQTQSSAGAFPVSMAASGSAEERERRVDLLQSLEKALDAAETC